MIFSSFTSFDRADLGSSSPQLWLINPRLYLTSTSRPTPTRAIKVLFQLAPSSSVVPCSSHALSSLSNRSDSFLRAQSSASSVRLSRAPRLPACRVRPSTGVAGGERGRVPGRRRRNARHAEWVAGAGLRMTWECSRGNRNPWGPAPTHARAKESERAGGV